MVKCPQVNYYGLIVVSSICLQEHPWVTYGGKQPLPCTSENCTDIEVTEDDIQNSVKSIPKIKTLVRRLHRVIRLQLFQSLLMSV